MQRIGNYIKICFLILLSLTPIFWLIRRPGILIDGVDTNFPLDPSVWFQRRFFTWTAVGNAGSNFSASVAGTFFHFIQFLPFKLGLSLQIVELISLCFWFSLIIFSSWFLSRIFFSKKSIPQLVFVTLYSLNIWLFNSWENVKVANLSLAAAIPLGISVLLMLRDKKIKRGTASLWSIFIGIILAGAGINPAYIICFFVILAIVFLGEIFVDFGEWGKNIDRFKDFLLVAIFITLVNLFWILPSLSFIFGNITASNSIGALGFTNWVDSLSENTSFVNVLRMQGAWDWYTIDSATRLPLYIPYALNYFYNPLFIGFSFLIPFLAFMAFIFRNKKQALLYLSFGIMLVLGIFLTSGTHPPSGDLFNFFAKHVPFFSLFRSPWYIFAPLIGLSIAGLVSIFFDSVTSIIPPRIIQIFGILFIIGTLFYSYPLLLGKVFRPASSNGFFIKFPSYIFDTRDYLSKTNVQGRILSYPDDNIEKFNWGYSGTDSILNLFSDKEVVFTPLNDVDSPLSKIVANTYLSIKKNELTKAKNLSNSLSVTQIFDKRDQSSLAPALPKQILDNNIAKFGPWSFYNLQNNPSASYKIKAVNCCELSYPYDDSANNLSLLSANELLVNPNDSLFTNAKLMESSGLIVHTVNSQIKDFVSTDFSFKSSLKSRLTPKDLSVVRFSFSVPRSGNYSPIMERRGLDFFGILNQNKLNVTIDGKKEVWTVDTSDDSYLYFQPTNFSGGEHEVVIGVPSKNLIDESNYNKKGSAVFDYTSGVFTIFNSQQKDAAFDFSVNGFDPYANYLVSFGYLQVFGNDAQVIVQQNRDSALYVNQPQSLPVYPFWQTFSFYYRPVQTESTLDIELTEPATNDAFGTRVQFRSPSVYKLFDNDLFFKMQPNYDQKPANVSYKENSPVSYTGKLTGGTGSQIILFNENYSPDWQLSIDGNLPIKTFHFTGNYYANAWYVDNRGKDFTFTVTYRPQNLLKIGYVIAGASVFGVIIYFMYDKARKHGK